MPKKIIFIEDDLLVSEMYVSALKEAGYEVLALNTPEPLLRYLSKERYDLVITNIMLPYRDGLRILKDLKDSYIFHNLPVIILSSLDSENIINEAKKHKVTKYLIKYVTKPHELVKEVKDFFKEDL